MGVPNWDEYFFRMAETASLRASCLRTQVGCVVVKDKKIIATGYNSAPSGRMNCVDLGYCYRDRYSIESGTRLEMCHSAGAHAELNAMIMGAKHGSSSMGGATLYLTGHKNCCVWCQSSILNVGIFKVMIKTRSGEVKIFYPAEDFLVHPLLPSC